MDDRETVLSTNEAFYDAFGAGDMDAMGAIWSKDSPITCLHPGWDPLSGREAVLESWRGILESPARPRIECTSHEVHVYDDAAVVLCYESLGNGYLFATNVFVREGEGWKLTHHHAGGPVPPPQNETS